LDTLPAQVVEILLVQSQQNISEVVDKGSARIAPDAFYYLNKFNGFSIHSRRYLANFFVILKDVGTCMKMASPWRLMRGTRGSTSRDTVTRCVRKLHVDCAPKETKHVNKCNAMVEAVFSISIGFNEGLEDPSSSFYITANAEPNPDPDPDFAIILKVGLLHVFCCNFKNFICKK
jgi:hypothetical protein